MNAQVQMSNNVQQRFQIVQCVWSIVVIMIQVSRILLNKRCIDLVYFLKAKFDRSCCWWNCGTPNQVTDRNGKPTYFCNADKCNGPGSEAMLGYIS